MRKKGRTSTLMRKMKKKRRRKRKKRQENPTREEKREREKTTKMTMTTTDKNSHSKRGATYPRLEVLFMYRVVNGVQEVLIMSLYKSLLLGLSLEGVHGLQVAWSLVPWSCD